MAKVKSSEESQFLASYDPKIYDRPNTTVDIVIYTIYERALHVLITRRTEHPYKSVWSLVGGFVDIHNDKDLESTAMRKLYEKTGIRTPYLEQFETIGSNSRDPRCWTITTVYFALLPYLALGTGATDVKWEPIFDGEVNERLAFDHNQILKSCNKRLRNKVLYTSLPLYLVGTTFTLVELQEVYEILLNEKIDAKSFRRRMLSAGIIEETGKMRAGSRRPAKLYRRVTGMKPHYFLRNIEASGIT